MLLRFHMSRGEKEMKITERISEFVVETSFEDMSEEVVQIAKEFVLDSIGASLIGSLEPASKIARKYIEEIGGLPEAGVIGGGFKTSVINAAFLNGTSNHASELEACGDFAGCNPLSVIPVALAFGEKLRLTGKKILEGIIVGFEIQGKMGMATTPGSHAKGWCSISLHGTLGAAVTAAKMLELSVDQTRMALGIAADQASGLMRQLGTMTHLLEGGLGCRNGVLAATLAKMGLTAADDIFDGHPSFWEVYVGEGNFDPEKMMNNLGSPFYFLSPGISMKKYPCCFFMHRALDAALQLIEKHKIDYENVGCIEAGVTPFIYDALVGHENPKSGDMARFSLEHCLASAILKKKVTVDSFTDEEVRSQVFKEAREKVKLTVHPEWPSGRSALVIPITVKLRDGNEFSNKVERLMGSAELPLNRNEQIERYKGFASPFLSDPEIEQSVDLILNVDELSEITDLMNILTFGRRRASM
jgi:2-methylcitrate dehydratase PrpD